jgi:hypothetical protein
MIIGLSGYARSGKDTVAQFFVENYGYTRVAFADNIRHMLLDLNPYVGIGPSNYNHTTLSDLVALNGWEGAKQHPEVRRLLQDLGVSARNYLGEDVWINAALSTPTQNDGLVITDVRFINEAEAIKNRGGQIWRVIRPGVTAVNSHISETQMDGYSYDRIVDNSGDFKDLSIEIASLISR